MLTVHLASKFPFLDETIFPLFIIFAQTSADIPLLLPCTVPVAKVPTQHFSHKVQQCCNSCQQLHVGGDAVVQRKKAVPLVSEIGSVFLDLLVMGLTSTSNNNTIFALQNNSGLHHCSITSIYSSTLFSPKISLKTVSVRRLFYLVSEQSCERKIPLADDIFKIRTSGIFPFTLSKHLCFA